MEVVKLSYHINTANHLYLTTTLLAKKSIKIFGNNFLELLPRGKIITLASNRITEGNIAKAKMSKCLTLAKWA